MATLDEIKIEVNKYYENILQRTPIDDEVNGWAAPVNSGTLTIDQVRQFFIDSSEAQHVAGVVRFYQAAFGRVPDQQGLKNWVNSGLSMDQIADGFAGSDEFFNRYGSGNGNEEYITSLYLQVLGRAPDAEGLANWMNSGLSAAQILAGFSESQEFKSNTSTEVSAFLDECGKGTQDYEGKLDDYSPEPEPEPEFTISGGLEALAAANTAKAEFLITADGDDDEETSADEGDVGDGLAAAEATLDNLIGGPSYVGASARLKAALLADEIDFNNEALVDAQTTLAEAEAAIAEVEGLTEAISDLAAAKDETEAAGEVVIDADAALAASVASYNVRNITDISSVSNNGVIAGLIELNEDDELVLATGVTETTNKGITAVLNASIAKEAADEAVTEAQAAQDAAQLVVNDLDMTPDAVAALEAIAEALGLEEGERPTLELISTEISRLEGVRDDAQDTASTDAVALRMVATDADLDADDAEAADAAVTTAQGELNTTTDGVAALSIAINAVTWDSTDTATEDAVEALTAQAVFDGFISVDDKTAIDTAFSETLDFEVDLSGAKTDAMAVLNTNNQVDDLTSVFEGAEATADATDAVAMRADADAADLAADEAEAADQAALDADEALATFQDLVDTYTTEAAVKLTTALTDAEEGVEAAQATIDELADAVAAVTDAQKLVTDLGELNKTIDAAEKAFTDNGLELPITLVNSSHDATEGSDIFLAGSGNSEINDFGLLGDDMLYVGSKFTLNTGDLADDGIDSVLEMFLVESGNDTVVTLEAKPFGSNSSDEEQTITLVGVAVEDVKFENGFISTTGAIV